MAPVLNQWKGDVAVRSVAVSPDSSRIGAACGNDIVIVDTDSGQTVLGPLQGHAKWIQSVAFSQDGDALASGSWDNTIHLWDMETGKAAMRPRRWHTGSVNSVAFTSDGRLLVSASSDHTIRLWDARTGEPGRTINTGESVWTMAVSSDGTRVVGARHRGIIRTYDTATRSMLFQCTGHTDAINSVAFSPDGHRLASGSDDHTVRLWDGSMGHAIGSSLEGHTDHVRSVSFSPDGRYIASAADDKTIRLWGVDTGTSLCNPLTDHLGYVPSVVFAPDGRRLVSGSFDQSIRIWDVQHLEITRPNKPSQPAESTKLEVRGGLSFMSSSDPEVLQLTEQANRPHPIESAELEIEITATTSARDIVSHLGAHGCIDMTNSLNLTKCSDYPISSGGFGDIYRCELRDSTEVAMKTIRVYAGGDERNFKALKRAAREIYTWSKCRHPNVQPLLGLVVFRGQIGMVARWEANGNLSQYLRRYPEADRCVMNAQIADGLAYLHSSGVVHGDLKAVNVLVSKGGVAQLTDFGSAVLHEYTLQFSQTSTKPTLTIRWASPEILRGGKCSREADVYALGMTVLETVTGEVPWGEKSDLGVLSLVLFEKAIPARPVGHIPTGSEHGNMLWSLLTSCWTYEPDERPLAETVANKLRGIAQEGLKAIRMKGAT